MPTINEGGSFCGTCYSMVTRPHIHNPKDRAYFEQELGFGEGNEPKPKKAKEPTNDELLAKHHEAVRARMRAGVSADHPFPGELPQWEIMRIVGEMPRSVLFDEGTPINIVEDEEPKTSDAILKQMHDALKADPSLFGGVRGYDDLE